MNIYNLKILCKYVIIKVLHKFLTGGLSMFIDNTCYVTDFYNSQIFSALVKEQLSKEATAPLSKELIELAISAMLSCEESQVASFETKLMRRHLMSRSICFEDYRDVENTPGSYVIGNPEDAVSAFNKLIAKART